MFLLARQAAARRATSWRAKAKAGLFPSRGAGAGTGLRKGPILLGSPVICWSHLSRLGQQKEGSGQRVDVRGAGEGMGNL